MRSNDFETKMNISRKILTFIYLLFIFLCIELNKLYNLVKNKTILIDIQNNKYQVPL